MNENQQQRLVTAAALVLAALILASLFGCGSTATVADDTCKNDVLGWTFMQSAVWGPGEEDLMIAAYREPVYGWTALVVAQAGTVPATLVQKAYHLCYASPDVATAPNGAYTTARLVRSDCQDFDDMMDLLRDAMLRRRLDMGGGVRLDVDRMCWGPDTEWTLDHCYINTGATDAGSTPATSTSL